MDEKLHEMDAVAQWRSTFGKSPARMDWEVIDALPARGDREQSPSYLREVTGVIPVKHVDNAAWWTWAQARDSWRDGLIEWNVPNAHALAKQQVLFLRACGRIMRNRERCQVPADATPAVDELPLHKMAFGDKDVTYGSPKMRIKYLDAKSKYTGRCTIQWTTEFTDDGRAYRVREYRVQMGGKRPVIFRDNEIVRKRFNKDTGMWLITLAHKDRS